MYLLNIETVTAKWLQITWHILVQTTHDILEELDHDKENTMKPANDWAAKRPSEYSKRGVQEEAKAKISSSRPRGGKRTKATSEHSLLCQQVNSETGLYMEMQQRKFCQLRALNALSGRNIVQPQTMLDFCAKEIRMNTKLGKTLKNGGYCLHDGNFPDMAINAWLHHNCQPKARLKSIEEGIPCGSNETAFTGCLPPHMDAFVLRWNQGRHAHEDTGYGHAVCIRRHPVTKDWYLLDSENLRARRITPSLWTGLKGLVFVLAEGSGYNHNVIVGARDEGYTQAEEESRLLMLEQVTLTNISGARSRSMTRKKRQGDTTIDPMTA